MKIRMYVVTYKNSKDLHTNLESLFASDKDDHVLEVSIINNHSSFHVDDKFRHIPVLHNCLRPDWSTGHLSRNWNQAIINGFVKLTAPACDILVTCQDDTVFDVNWLKNLVQLHQKYTFIQSGVGDNFCSYMPEAVARIGLWDERFCGIGYQEADYFVRAYLHNNGKSSINDFHHGRVFNTHGLPICRRTTDIVVNNVTTLSSENVRSSRYHPLNKNLFLKKWGINPEKWTAKSLGRLPRASHIENYVYYPYFELDCVLKNKNYHCDNAGKPFGD